MGKKIIVGCDGTWLNSDDGFNQSSYAPWASATKGTKAPPSNVTRICRALQPRPPKGEDKFGNTTSGNTQIVDYEPGIGSANNWWDHFVNGATAMSIGDNVCSGYRSIVEKWEPGDEIFLFGFSRGSFIARSIAAMIRYVGLLDKEGMEYFYDIFEDWENQNIQDYKQHRYPGKRFDDETNDDWCSYAMQLQRDGLTRLDVPIKAIGCFDTVGSLGVPTLGWRKPTRSYAFVNTEILSNVEACFHALALDEQRKPFAPTLWEAPAKRAASTDRKVPHTLRQCWFPGVHSCIGGSVEDAELPNVALAWMVDQMRPYLDFDEDYLAFLYKVNAEYYAKMRHSSGKAPADEKNAGAPARFKEPPKWGMGYIENNQKGIVMLGGSATRTPGRYYRTDPKTGAPKDERLQNTMEVVHPSVRLRHWDRKNGKGVEDSAPYDPAALKGCTLMRNGKNGHGDAAEGDPSSKGWSWARKDDVAGGEVILQEETMGEAEQMLLGAVKDGIVIGS